MFCVSRRVSTLSVRMSDPAVKRVVSDIIRSPEDKREYRGLEFTNGLKAILISDPTTDKSSAALDVHIGKWEFLYFFPILHISAGSVTPLAPSILTQAIY